MGLGWHVGPEPDPTGLEQRHNNGHRLHGGLSASDLPPCTPGVSTGGGEGAVGACQRARHPLVSTAAAGALRPSADG